MRVNGIEEEYAFEILEDFLNSKGFDTQRIAVELNKEIITRANFPTTRLNKDDVLEIVHFVGGG